MRKIHFKDGDNSICGLSKVGAAESFTVSLTDSVDSVTCNTCIVKLAAQGKIVHVERKSVSHTVKAEDFIGFRRNQIDSICHGSQIRFKCVTSEDGEIFEISHPRERGDCVYVETVDDVITKAEIK